MARRNRKQSDVTGSKITLGGVRSFSIQHKDGFDYCQCSATVSRSTEQQAEARMNAGHLSDMHITLLRLERIALNPKAYYKTFPAAPKTPLWGYKLAEWVGQQVGWTATDVERALDTASSIMLLIA